MCDGIAIVTLHGLGMDVSRLMSGVQKISRLNRERLGTANNERDYPTLAQHQAFARAMEARSEPIAAGGHHPCCGNRSNEGSSRPETR